MKIAVLFSTIFLSSTFCTTLETTTPKTKVAYIKFSHRALTTGSGPIGEISITIDKSDYELSVYDSKGWYATYPVVFGNNTLEDKKMEGDRNTPEGSFKVLSKRVHDKWYRFLALDYPNKESYDKFNARKSRGEIPQNARIGGSIGIHGTWPNDDYVVNNYQNWTMGCISMKNIDVEEIFQFTPVGSRVLIKR